MMEGKWRRLGISSSCEGGDRGQAGNPKEAKRKYTREDGNWKVALIYLKMRQHFKLP